MLPSKCLILASGSSVLSGIPLGLSNLIESNITFGINEAIKFCNCTIYTFGDWCAYADRFDLYKSRPLVIGRHDCHIGRKIEGARECPKHDSLILLKSNGNYQGHDGLKKGLYSPVLTGAFTLSIAIQLGFTEIYLLGFDNCAINGLTHWYEPIEGAGQFKDYEGKPTCGVGKNEDGKYRTSFYNKDDIQINALWEPFKIELNKIKIFNVSPESRITIFPKITYPEFFKKLNENPISIDQEAIQNEIRMILTPFNKAE